MMTILIAHLFPIFLPLSRIVRILTVLVVVLPAFHNVKQITKINKYLVGTDEVAGYLSIVDSDSVTDTGESVDDTTDSFENLKMF